MYILIKNKQKKNFYKISMPRFVLFIYWTYFITAVLDVFSYCTQEYIFAARMLIGASAILYCLIQQGINDFLPVMLFVIIYTIWGLVAHLYNSNSDLIELLWPIAFIGVSLIFSQYILPIRIANIYVYCFLTILLIYGFFHNGLDVRVLKNVNSMNVYLLILNCILAFSYDKYKQNTMSLIMSSFFSLLVVLWSLGRSGGGRSGTMVFFFLLIANIIIYIYYKSSIVPCHKHKNIVDMIVFIIVAFLFIYIGYNVDIITERITFLMRRGLHSPRWGIWQDYTNICCSSFLDFIFGARYMNMTEYLTEFRHNLHNSFFMLHAKYTIVMVIIILILILYAMAYFIKHRQYILSCYFLALIIRMNFDYTNFNAPMDSIFFAFIFMPILKKVSSKNLSERS